MSQKQKIQVYGNHLVNDLQVYLRSLHTHQANNEIVVQAREALYATLRSYFDREPSSTLEIQLLPEETFINNTLLPVALKDFDRVRDLTADLRKMNIGELIFDNRVSRESLSKLAEVFYVGLHAKTQSDTREWLGIRARHLNYSSVGTSERNAHQVCVWLYAGLLDGLEGLADLVEEGETPTLVPFMRHIRLLVKLSEERSTVLRHLCLARADEAEHSQYQRMVCRTFMAVLFCRHHGMDRSGLLAMGLASILDMVTMGVEPEEVLPTLVPYTSLSDLAPQVMMTLRDLNLARQGLESNLRAQTLHILDRLVVSIHSKAPISVDSLKSALRELQGIEPELVEAVLQWVGEQPIGAVGHSQDLGRVLLYDMGDDGKTLRCRPIYDSELGEVVPCPDLDPERPIYFDSRRLFVELVEENEGDEMEEEVLEIDIGEDGGPLSYRPDSDAELEEEDTDEVEDLEEEEEVLEIDVGDAGENLTRRPDNDSEPKEEGTEEDVDLEEEEDTDEVEELEEEVIEIDVGDAGEDSSGRPDSDSPPEEGKGPGEGQKEEEARLAGDGEGDSPGKSAGETEAT